MDTTKFDLVVIGGGPAGLSGALAAGAFGKKVALIEQEQLVGGAGINTGTLPSKTLRESALMISGARARKLLGIQVALKPKAKLAEFTHHAGQVSAAERARMELRIKETKVTRFCGRGTFKDAHTISISESAGKVSTVSGDVILIATGSSPVRPPEFPFEHPHVHDSDEILKISELPTSLAVVGAGVIGAEYASTFAALGVEVHLIDGRDTLLPFLDTDVSQAISKGMQSLGVRFHWRERVEKCEGLDSHTVLTLTSGQKVKAADILVAAGRSSNTEHLNLAAAGLVAGKRGLLSVDSSYRTNVAHIYAVGDVIGFPALAATGMEQARVAACHAFQLLNKETSSILPTGIYTIPEASMAGQTEAALREAKVDFIVGLAPYANNPRGRIIGDDGGFLKLVFNRSDMKLLGVHAVGEQATELVHIGLIALHCGGDAQLFSRVCFNYPTLGELYKYAAYDAMLQKHALESAEQRN